MFVPYQLLLVERTESPFSRSTGDLITGCIRLTHLRTVHATGEKGIRRLLDSAQAQAFMASQRGDSCLIQSLENHSLRRKFDNSVDDSLSGDTKTFEPWPVLR